MCPVHELYQFIMVFFVHLLYICILETKIWILFYPWRNIVKNFFKNILVYYIFIILLFLFRIHWNISLGTIRICFWLFWIHCLKFILKTNKISLVYKFIINLLSFILNTLMQKSLLLVLYILTVHINYIFKFLIFWLFFLSLTDFTIFDFIKI